MSDGTISGNSASAGSGVYIKSGTFTMNGGTIHNNPATLDGGGARVDNGGTFTMSGGIISDNSAVYDGGGVYSSGTFTMSGGTLSDNSAGNGGGAFVGSGTFTMSGGTLSGNSATSHGGGVYVDNFSGTGTAAFIKTSGTVYGGNAGDPDWNQADSDGMGHAVYKTNSAPTSNQYRDTTAGPEQNIDTGSGTGLSEVMSG
jgi:predicted outer membrane repeat protein